MTPVILNNINVNNTSSGGIQVKQYYLRNKNYAKKKKIPFSRDK